MSAQPEREEIAWPPAKVGEVGNQQPYDNISGKFYYESIVIPETDLLLGDGPGQAIDLVAAKTEVAMGSLLQKLSRAVYGTSPNNTASDLDPITGALAAASTGTYAGIAISAANGFWICGGNGQLAGAWAVGGAFTLANLQTLYGSATWGNEEPDTLLFTQTGWNSLWGLLQANQRFIEHAQDPETTRAGFRHLTLGYATGAIWN